VEVVVPWQALVSLTPDATQITDGHWIQQRRELRQLYCSNDGASNEAISQQYQELAAAFDAALLQQILPLKTVVLDVQLATAGPCVRRSFA